MDIQILWLVLSLLTPRWRGDGQDPADRLAALRNQMVETQIASRGIKDPGVLAAMRRVPRHLFVPDFEVENAYDDRPLPIGHGQTISQPYIVALMTELARPGPADRVLEVGTGSGYQAAVIAGLVSHVFTMEIVEPLADQARARLASLGVKNVTVRTGDGYSGWPEQAPFDIILVTAAPERVPPALIEQLKPGGRLVIPVGSVYDLQELQLIEKTKDGRLRTEHITGVRFVPMRRK
ncbi:MAG: protein-L-isoaspartate(D-aspartate) O-methyltransferase [Vicinamibacterales bacterium]